MMDGVKVVVYTALVDDYDYLRPVPKGLEGIDFVCFTDKAGPSNSVKCSGWRLTSLPEGTGSSRKTCRFIKALPQKFFSGYDISVWVDSNISFKKSISDLVDEFIDSNALIRGFRHPIRTCAYTEAQECIKQGKDLEKNLTSMIEYMRSSGFPENQGLTETNVLFRKHNTQKVKALNEDWSYFLNEFTIRDQISFDCLCWRHDIDVWYFEGATHFNQHNVFNRGLHRSENKLKDFYAYIESLQGVYPYLSNIISFFYAIRG